MGYPLLLFIKTFINLRCTKGIGNIGGLEIKISLVNLDAAVTGRFIATPTGDSLKSTLSQSGIPEAIRLKFFDVHSQLYLNLIPVLNSGRIELAADRKMIEELRRLERRRRRRYSPRISICISATKPANTVLVGALTADPCDASCRLNGPVTSNICLEIQPFCPSTRPRVRSNRRVASSFLIRAESAPSTRRGVSLRCAVAQLDSL